MIIVPFAGTILWILASSVSLQEIRKREIAFWDGDNAIMLSIFIASQDGLRIGKFVPSATKSGTSVTTALEIKN